LQLDPSQKHKIEEPGLVDFAEINFLWMVSNEGENYFLSETVNIPTVSVAPHCPRS